jgi:predicted phosphoribosyltransferase
MYFASRAQAGQTLAADITQKYTGKPCSVLALSDGAVVVGLQIASALHAPLGLLLTEGIELPRETDAIAGVSENGEFAYNSAYSTGELEEMTSEYRSLIEQEKLAKMRELHVKIGRGMLMREDLLMDRHVILVSDGLNGSFSLDVANTVLKPIQIQRLVVATPLANVQAVDRIHIMADDIYCLDVIEDFISIDHYYDTQDVPDHDVIIQTVEQLMGAWK